MLWDSESGRSSLYFWKDLGFDHEAATAAHYCFPESFSAGRYVPSRKVVTEGQRWVNEQAEQLARDSVRKLPLVYRMDPLHPAFWIAQGCSFDEAAARAIAMHSIMEFQLAATPPPPPQRDMFPEVVQALLMQGAMRRQLEGPDSRDDQCYDTSPSQEPFDPDDYPRFRTGGS
jgi:hypothetical protein